MDINGTVQFVCLYEGSLALPTWKINGLDYSYLAMLPSKHQIDLTGSYLTVHNVDISMEGNTYQCVINSCFSDTGHLYVHLQGVYTNKFVIQE